MISIYVDDIRSPNENFDMVARTTDDTMKYIRRKYKEGQRHFFLDLDHDAGNDAPGGDFINILKQIEAYVYMGKMRDIDVDVHFHSGNVVGIDNMRQIVLHNSFMQEVW